MEACGERQKMKHEQQQQHHSEDRARDNHGRSRGQVNPNEHGRLLRMQHRRDCGRGQGPRQFTHVAQQGPCCPNGPGLGQAKSIFILCMLQRVWDDSFSFLSSVPKELGSFPTVHTCELRPTDGVQRPSAGSIYQALRSTWIRKTATPMVRDRAYSM